MTATSSRLVLGTIASFGTRPLLQPYGQEPIDGGLARGRVLTPEGLPPNGHTGRPEVGGEQETVGEIAGPGHVRSVATRKHRIPAGV